MPWWRKEPNTCKVEEGAPVARSRKRNDLVAGYEVGSSTCQGG